MSDNAVSEMDERLDAYLDGFLEPREREAFEREIARSPALRAQVEMQDAIDASLQRVFTPPGQCVMPTTLKLIPADAARSARRRRLALSLPIAAAALLMLAVGIWPWWVGDDTPLPDGLTYKTVDAVFRETVADGFKPQFVCKTDREFASAFYHRLGQALLPNRPENVEWIGVSRGLILTTRTHYILLKVDGREVLVFVERADVEAKGLPSVGPELYIYRQRLNQLVLYEVTTAKTSEVLHLFYEPDIPQEWKDDVPGW